MEHTTNTVTEGNTSSFSINTKKFTYSDSARRQVKQSDGSYKYYNVVTEEQLPSVPHLWRSDWIVKFSDGNIISFTGFDSTDPGTVSDFTAVCVWLNNHGYTNGENPGVTGVGWMSASGWANGNCVTGVYTNGYATMIAYTTAGDDGKYTSSSYIHHTKRQIF